MPKVIYRQRDGTEKRIDLAIGHSIMEGAVQNNMPGIDAECGGNCACATCHVYIDAGWFDKVGEKSSLEDAMLILAPDLKPNSRLSCQIAMRADLEGMIVEIPQSQR